MDQKQAPSLRNLLLMNCLDQMVSDTVWSNMLIMHLSRSTRCSSICLPDMHWTVEQSGGWGLCLSWVSSISGVSSLPAPAAWSQLGPPSVPYKVSHAPHLPCCSPHPAGDIAALPLLSRNPPQVSGVGCSFGASWPCWVSPCCLPCGHRAAFALGQLGLIHWSAPNALSRQACLPDAASLATCYVLGWQSLSHLAVLDIGCRGAVYVTLMVNSLLLLFLSLITQYVKG